MSIAKTNGSLYSTPPNVKGSGSNNDGGIVKKTTSSDNLSSVSSANPGCTISVPVESVESSVSNLPSSSKTTTNYAYSKYIRGTKTASAIRNDQFNINSGEFDNSYPRVSKAYWNTDPVSGQLVFEYDPANIDSYAGAGSGIYDLVSENTGTLYNSVAFNSDNGGNLIVDGIDTYIDNNYTPASGEEMTFGLFFKTPNTDPQKCGLVGFRSAWGSYAPGGTRTVCQCLIYITNDSGAGTFGKGVGFWNWHGEVMRSPFFSAQRSTFAFDYDVCDTNWHQVVAVKSRASSQLWVDGMLMSENSDGDTMPEVTPGGDDANPTFTIGAADNGSTILGGFYFNGSIGNSFYYNRALTGEEIKKQYFTKKNNFDYYDEDPDVKVFRQITGASDLNIIRALVKYLKNNSLWNRTRFWTFKSNQNKGSGDIVYGLGGLTNRNMNLLNSPTWGENNMSFDGTNQLAYTPDFLSDATMNMFWRGTNNTNLGVSIGQYEPTGDQRSIILRKVNTNISVLRISGGSYAGNNEDYGGVAWPTAEPSTISVQSFNSGGVEIWKDTTNTNAARTAGTEQTKHFDSNANVTMMGFLNNGSPLNVVNGTCLFGGIITGEISSADRTNITNLINLL